MTTTAAKFSKGQAVKVTRGQQRGATGKVYGQIGEQYIIALDPGRSVSSVTVKAPSLKAL
jgi:hypothetical protein